MLFIPGSRQSGPPRRSLSASAGSRNNAHSSIAHVVAGDGDHGPATSVGRLHGANRPPSTSVLRQKESTAQSSISATQQKEENRAIDEARYDYSRRRIFATKAKEKHSQQKQARAQLQGSSIQARSYMRKMIDKYAWKKPIDDKYTPETRKEMKKKIDQSAKYQHLSKDDVAEMKKVVDSLE